MVIIGLVLIAMAIWLWKLDQGSASSTSRVSISKLLAGLCVIGAIAAPSLSLSESNQPQKWQAYSAEKLNSLRIAGKPVLVNLTADWCITCLVNERVALGSDEFYDALEQNNMTYLKGDWTNNDPQITNLLNEYQRSGVPLYLVFPEGPGAAEILPQILLEPMVLDAIKRAKR